MFGQEGVFVDPCSPLDPYPAQLWTEIAKYFASLDEETGSLPSGRYLCAQVLMSRQLSFLGGRSLGEVCHIVQLAISQKKILGYAKGQLVPYCFSEECTKARCAVRLQPMAAAGAGAAEMPFATWDDLRSGLCEILEASCNPGPRMITLSNVKRLFRSQLHLDLSETVLGHSRVWELLQDPRLHDVCIVHAYGNGQAVVQRVHTVPAPQAFCGTGAAPLPLPMPSVQPAAGHFPFSTAPAPSPFSTCASNRQAFVQPYAAPPAAPPMPLSTTPVAYAAAPQMPQGTWTEACSPFASTYMPIDFTEKLYTESSTCGETSTCAGSPRRTSTLDFSVFSCNFSDVEESASRAGSADVGSSHAKRPWATSEIEDSASTTGPDSEVPGRVPMPEACGSLRSSVCSLDSDDEMVAAVEDLQSELEIQGYTVKSKNTFIEISPKAQGSRRRTQSLPRAFFSVFA